MHVTCAYDFAYFQLSSSTKPLAAYSAKQLPDYTHFLATQLAPTAASLSWPVEISLPFLAFGYFAILYILARKRGGCQALLINDIDQSA